ncbi:MAG: hypothetical protein WAM09_18485 [Anaerolineales bacterium]|jgi:hypothetical protein
MKTRIIWYNLFFLEDLDQTRWCLPAADLEKDRSEDFYPLSIFFHDLEGTRPLLDHEQEFWLAMDVQAGLRRSQAISSDGI